MCSIIKLVLVLSVNSGRIISNIECIVFRLLVLALFFFIFYWEMRIKDWMVGWMDRWLIGWMGFVEFGSILNLFFIIRVFLIAKMHYLEMLLPGTLLIMARAKTNQEFSKKSRKNC